MQVLYKPFTSNICQNDPVAELRIAFSKFHILQGVVLCSDGTQNVYEISCPQHNSVFFTHVHKIYVQLSCFKQLLYDLQNSSFINNFHLSIHLSCNKV